MTTEEQKKDDERLERYIAREGLVSAMNDTKWRELRAAMLNDASFSPKYRVKCLLMPEEQCQSWDGDWYYHLPTFREIEWIDIDPIRSVRRGHLVTDVREDATDELSRLLRSHSIPFEIVGHFLRIYGYRRPNNRNTAPDK